MLIKILSLCGEIPVIILGSVTCLCLHVSAPSVVLQVATVSERSRIMELEREVADLQLRLRASQQKEDAASLSQQQISSLKAQAQSQEKKVCGSVSPRGFSSQPKPGLLNGYLSCSMA